MVQVLILYKYVMTECVWYWYCQLEKQASHELISTSHTLS